MATMLYSPFKCSSCNRVLTIGEAELYRCRRVKNKLCVRCRPCPDDCRRTPCDIQVTRAFNIVEKALGRVGRLPAMGNVGLQRREIAALIATNILKGELELQNQDTLTWFFHRGKIFYSIQ